MAKDAIALQQEYSAIFAKGMALEIGCSKRAS